MVLCWDELDWVVLGCVACGCGCVGMNWVVLSWVGCGCDCVRMNCVGLDWAWLGYVVLHCVALPCVVLQCTQLCSYNGLEQLLKQ